jgi:dihydrolipoamide dehydrogenase
VDGIKPDFSSAIDRSRKIVSKLTAGVRFLLKKNGVEVIQDTGSMIDNHRIRVAEAGQVLSADNVIIATGARQRALPPLPIDGRVIITSRHALETPEVPKRIVIVGAGATGAEFAYLYRTYGSEVTLVELLPRIVPNEDEEVSQQLQRSFSHQGIKAITGSEVQKVDITGPTAVIEIRSPDGEAKLECDKVLVAVGVQGNVDGIGLENVGVEIKNSFVAVNDSMRTNIENIYAIGDVTGKLLLAHVASAQGVIAAEVMAGMNPPSLDYSLMPKATYCKPQIASFGLTETQAKEAGHSIRIGKFPLSASGKAMAMGETEGFIKLVVDTEIGEILGAHMIGAEVTELLGEMALARLLEGTTTEIGSLVHPHPTISETLKEAALAADGEAIHV